MLPALRSLVITSLLLVLMSAPSMDVLAQARGRTSGRDGETSRTGRTEEPAKRAPSRTEESRNEKSRTEEKKSEVKREPARDESEPRITRSAQQRTGSSEGTTSRGDRQRGDAERPQRERTPSNEATPPTREVDRDRDNSEARNRSRADDRSRNASRTARGGRVVTPPPAAAPPVVVTHPHRVRVDAFWPWEWRRQHSWSPRYRFRQRVIVNAGWLGHRRNDVIEVETTYRHRLRRADGRRAEIDVYIERIALFDRGRFIGEVDRIPNDLGRIRANVYRNGRVTFDREVFLVGSRYDGFELVNTRYYDGYILDAYSRKHGYRAGRLDLRRERVVPVRRSQWFNPFAFAGHVPLSLLPDDRGWLLDYGRESITGYYYNSRGDYDRYDDDYPDDRGWTYRNFNSSAPGEDRLERRYDREITTKNGAVIELKREEVLQRLDD